MGHETPDNPPEGMGNMEDPFEDLENFKPAERDSQLKKLGREMFEAAEHEEYQKATRICQKLIQLENKLNPSQVKKHKEQEEKFLERAEETFSVNGESESSHLREDGCGVNIHAAGKSLIP